MGPSFCILHFQRLPSATLEGAVAQLGEHRVCNAGVTGSIPVGSILITAAI